MPNLKLLSQRQIQANILTTLISELGLNDVNAGSVIDVITNAVAQEDFSQYVAMAQIARLVDLDAITENDLDNKAFEYGITRFPARKASGKINILRDPSFVKVATTFYSGLPAPLVGDTVINVNDASNVLIGTSGTLILGRDTINEEEVSYIVAPVNNINYFTFTLSSPLTFSHAVEESVILKQGTDETIAAGSQILVPSTGVSASISFTVDNTVTLLAGESVILNVDVTANIAGSASNISIKAIDGSGAFASSPFPGAQAQNLQKFTTGRDLESDDELRDRIRSQVQSLSRGVKEAILNAVVGLVDPDTAKRVVSANLILPQGVVGPVKLYIDDGTGFEPSFASQGFEQVILSATGGEQRLQLDIQPVVKAQIENNAAEPYDMSGSSKTLIYNVGTQSETITFANSDFLFPDSASANEVVSAINDRSSLIEARTSEVGKQIVIVAKSETNDNIQVTGGTANAILDFPTDSRSTLYLYINDVLKSKDGETSFLDSGNQGPYNLSAIGSFPQTLTIVIDGKTANPQTVTFQSADFADPTAAKPAEIAAVINAQLAGAVASTSNNSTQVRITSNTLLSTKSMLHITGGTINNSTNGLNFTTSTKVGVDGDYTFNNETGTLELITPLVKNDSVTVGSLFTRAKLRAALPENYSPANGTTLLITVDGGSSQTITFDSSFVGGLSAATTAAFINLQLSGATASARIVGTQSFLEINTNTYDQSIGSIEISSASTALTNFGFPADTLAVNQRPHKAYRSSVNLGPYTFRQSDNLVVVMDNDIINNTYSINMNYNGTASAVSSTSIFSVSAYSVVFNTDNALANFYVAFQSGPTTVSGSGNTVTLVTGNTWRIAFSALPTGLSNIAVGDLVSTTGFVNTGNNGFFAVTNINTSGFGYIDVVNTAGVAESGAVATVIMSEKRTISSYTALTGQITTTAAFSSAPVTGNVAMVLPKTTTNLVNYMNNIRITSLSSQAIIEGINQNTQVQITSKLQGSDGYVQVTGGRANDILGFLISIYRGLQGYNYYTGLLKLVHRTLYGDDTDLVSFPGVSAAGIKLEVLAPTVREVSISVITTLKQGISISSVENEVRSSITSYINNLGVGDDVIIEEIRAGVIAIAGIIDVVLVTPLANIAIADNELARTNSSLILVG